MKPGFGEGLRSKAGPVQCQTRQRKLRPVTLKALTARNLMKDFWEAAGSANLGRGLRGQLTGRTLSSRYPSKDGRINSMKTSICVHKIIYPNRCIQSIVHVHVCLSLSVSICSKASSHSSCTVLASGDCRIEARSLAASLRAVATVLVHYHKISKPPLNKSLGSLNHGISGSAQGSGDSDRGPCKTTLKALKPKPYPKDTPVVQA